MTPAAVFSGGRPGFSPGPHTAQYFVLGLARFWRFVYSCNVMGWPTGDHTCCSQFDETCGLHPTLHRRTTASRLVHRPSTVSTVIDDAGSRLPLIVSLATAA
eukprot:scaffold47206_cov69-Phaeocystis_antarctica.AAC.3